jgi:hypothetical protein
MSEIPWDLRRRALKDSIRHDKRVKEAIRKNLKELIAEENIITSDGKKLVKLPLRYGYACEHGPQGQKRCQKCGEMAIQSRTLEDVVYSLVAPRYNYGAPRIVVANVNDDGSLLLEHQRNDLGPLDLKYAEKTLEHLHEVWKKPVHLKTFNNREEAIALTYSASGMEVGK